MGSCGNGLICLFPLLLSLLAARSSALCDAGEAVVVRRDHAVPCSSARVLHRQQGRTITVEWACNGSSGRIVKELSPTTLRTLHGEPCARAVLCLFGRVGNLHGKFDASGSTREALEISAPTIWEHVLGANPEFAWDVVAQTWDEQLAPAIRQVFRPIGIDAAPQADIDNLQSFGEASRRAAALKVQVEARGRFRYDLAVLMRYDIFWRQPLKLAQLVLPTEHLWTGHWCSIHSEDLAVREVVLNTSRDEQDIRSQIAGIYAPSQFAPSGLHDFWFAASSANIDRFAAWGEAVETLQSRHGLVTDAIPVHVGHFYTFLFAKSLQLPLGFLGISYLDYTLVRYRDCHLLVGEVVSPPDIFCSHWEISVQRGCAEWLPMPAHWASGFCPLAGKRAALVPGSRGCGRF